LGEIDVIPPFPGLPTSTSGSASPQTLFGELSQASARGAYNPPREGTLHAY